MNPHGWKTLLQSSLIGRRGEIAVLASGPVAREDWETLHEVIRLYLVGERWPTVDELRERYECAQGEAPHWNGSAEDRIQVLGQGPVGCPRCGGETRPVLASAEPTS